MIKGLILAGMCAMGGQHGITQSNNPTVAGEIEIVSELTDCNCNGQSIVECSARYRGKDGKLYKLDANGDYEAIDG